MTMLLQTNTALFFGRFHPLLVHLPIGFLVLAVILFVLTYFKKYHFTFKVLPIILFLGAASSVAAAIVGWLLSLEGGYPENTLEWHQWMGITVAIVSIAAWLWIRSILTKTIASIHKHEAEISDLKLHDKKKIGFTMALVLILIIITGHLGANLTHGETYLFDYAPNFIQALFIGDDKMDTNQKKFPDDADSILLYTHIIEPALNKKCASCHNENKMKGGLVLTNQEGLLKGGDNGMVLEKGSSQNSELFKRVCLDPGSKKFMPPKGAPMSYTEIALLSYWINNEMSFKLAITDESIPDEIQHLIQQGYGLSTNRKPFIEKEKVAPAPSEVLTSLRSQGYKIKTLAVSNNFLDVVAPDHLTSEKVEALLKIKDQITWLDLGHSGVQDEWTKIIGQFTNLTRLSLDNNTITDDGLVALMNLTHLETLNLHATQVSDIGLKQLAQQNSLRRVYVWQTKVTQQTVNAIRHVNPKLQIEMGEAVAEENQHP